MSTTMTSTESTKPQTAEPQAAEPEFLRLDGDTVTVTPDPTAPPDPAPLRLSRAEARVAADRVADPREILHLNHADPGYLNTLYWRRVRQDSDRAAARGSKAARRRAALRDLPARLARAEAQVHGAAKRHEAAEARLQAVAVQVGSLDKQIAELEATIEQARKTRSRTLSTAGGAATRARRNVWSRLDAALQGLLGTAMDAVQAATQHAEEVQPLEDARQALSQQWHDHLSAAERSLVAINASGDAAREEADRVYAAAASEVDSRIAVLRGQRASLAPVLERRLLAVRATQEKLAEARLALAGIEAEAQQAEAQQAEVGTPETDASETGSAGVQAHGH